MEVSDICRELANNFAQLAEELDKQQKKNESRMDWVEDQVEQNRDALKAAASAILSRFDGTLCPSE